MPTQQRRQFMNGTMMSEEVDVATQYHHERDVKPSLSLEISISPSSEANELSGALSFEEGEVWPAMEAACGLVQKLLDQVAWNDAPPSNEELSSIEKLESKSPKAPHVHSRQRHVRQKTPGGNNKAHLDTSSTQSHEDPSDLWMAHYKLRCNPAERKMGNVALATLCARTLETVGKPSLPTKEASRARARRHSPEEGKSPKASPWGRKTSPKKHWLLRRAKNPFASDEPESAPTPKSQASRETVAEVEERDDQVTHPSSLDTDEIEPNRLQMFGSEYARYLSATLLAPPDVPSRYTSHHPRGPTFRRRGIAARGQNLEEADEAILSGAITDLVITYGDDLPPKGYYRISQSGSGEKLTFRDRKAPAYINVKKEPNWDRAAQRPCVTALAVIFPERKEFVPPGFCVVRRQKSAAPNLPGESTPANLNFGGEAVYLCFRRSREGNPITGLIPLQPSKREDIPEGYTVLERTPRNVVANINPAGTPLFLAFRQRLANLEPLRPLPLVISVHNTATYTRSLQSYYCTGGTVVASRVGRFHVMDRSTHSLLSPSSVSNRLSLIEASRRKTLNSISDLPSGIVNTYSSSTHSRPPRSSNELLTSSLLLAHGLNTPGSRSVVSDLERLSSTGDFESVASNSEQHRVLISPDHDLKESVDQSYSTASLASDDETVDTQLVPSSPKLSQHLFIADDEELQRCLEALSFIPVVSTAVNDKDPRGMLRFQARVAILTPVLTACYTRHGGSALIAVEGLTSLLKGDFFASDVNIESDSSSRITLFDIAVQVVCDVATMGAQETHLQACVEFVEEAVRYGCGHLNTRTVGYVLRFYLFVFYFGASTPTRGSNPVWGSTSDIDEFMLTDPRESKSYYLLGGAPQSAALSLKDLIGFSITRLRSLTIADRIHNQGGKSGPEDCTQPPEFFNIFMNDFITEIVDDSVHRVDIANYTQLAMHQIHRSGGSELFWYDMMNSCGFGLFGNDVNIREEGRNMYTMCFAILTTLVKVACSRLRKDNHSEFVLRDVASKMLSLELIHFFLEKWGEEQEFLVVPGSRSLSTFAFCVRRLVVPCLLLNTREALDDPRIFRRMIRLVGILWCTPHYRSHMRLELGFLMEHFVLLVLQLGPQFPSKTPRTNLPLLLEQQIALMKELKTWFSGEPRDLLELFLNFDNESSVEKWSAPTGLLVCQRLNASLCSIAEKCSEFIGEQIKESQSMSSSPKGDPDADEHMEGESSMARARDGAQRLRMATLEAITQLVKCLTESAAIASGGQFRSLLQSWSNAKHIFRSYEDLAERPGDDSGEEDSSIISETSAESNGERGSGKGRAPLAQTSSSFGAPEAGDSIVCYWQRSIVTRKGTETGSEKIPPGKTGKLKVDVDLGPVYSGIARLKEDDKESGKIDHLAIAFDIAKKKSLNKAIDYLVACSVLTPSPRDIASFLRIHKVDLNPADLGKYLGEGGADGSETEYWNLIRFNYIRANSFVGMTVEQGLRHLLTKCGFRLPGEAQQIDRIMSTFAQCYWEDNAGDNLRCPFQDQDTVFLLAFAIIMLNTDLHKSYSLQSSGRRKERKRMTKAEFLTNLRGVTMTEELTQEYLSKIYDSIEDSPIMMHEEDFSESASEYGESLETHLSAMVSNVKTVDALLRGLSVHEYRFATIEDFSHKQNKNEKEAMKELARKVIIKTWHHFHGLINAAIEMAHLDLQGMESCVSILKYVLSLTILLDMPIERAAFMGQLGRYKLFNAWRRGLAGDLSADNESIKKEEWYLSIEDNCSKARGEKGKLLALEKVHSLICDLGLTLAVDVEGRKALREAVGRLRHAEYLLNDPGRSFIRQGNLWKRANRSGRSIEYRFFLFSDLLIYAKKIGNTDQYKIHEELPLILMKVVDWFPQDYKKESKRAFQIYHPRKNLLILAGSKEERKAWVSAIRTSIERELERKVAIEAARMAAAKSH